MDRRPDTDRASLTLHEEVAVARTERVATERVVLRKRVVTEDQTVTVQVRREIAELVRLEVVSPGRADVVAATCWSTVHGFATLATQGPMRELPRPAAMGLGMQIDHAITRGITGVSDLGVRTPIEMPAGRAPASAASPPEGDPSGERSGG